MSLLDQRGKAPISINVSITVMTCRCLKCQGKGRRWWFFKCGLCNGKGEWDLEHMTEAQADAWQADYQRQRRESNKFWRMR